VLSATEIDNASGSLARSVGIVLLEYPLVQDSHHRNVSYLQWFTAQLMAEEQWF
jgi:hypothetical protein